MSRLKDTGPSFKYYGIVGTLKNYFPMLELLIKWFKCYFNDENRLFWRPFWKYANLDPVGHLFIFGNI